MWPHLLVVEFVASLAMTAFLLVFSTFVNAPLLGQANFNLTPNPSKAPWYFLGLQELLTLFHPMVAGVMLPGMGLVGLGAAGYVDKNPSNKPEDRKFAICMFTLFMMFWAVLVIIGSVFRGEGQNFILAVAPRRSRDLRPVGEARMSTGAIIAIAVVVVVLLGVLFLATTSMRKDRAAAVGVLSRETLKRDRSEAAVAAVDPDQAAGGDRARDRAGRRARTDVGGHRRRPRPQRAPATAGPIDPETYGQTRRQFLNRGIVGHHGRQHLRLRCGGPRLSLAHHHGRLRRQDQRRHGRCDIQRCWSPRCPSTTPRAASTSTPIRPIGHPGQGQEGLQPGASSSAWSGLRRPVPEVRPPRLPGAVVPELAMVRVPLPRLQVQTGSERRRAARPRGDWTASLSASSDGSMTVDTRPSMSGPRSAPTPPARARGPALHVTGAEAPDGPGWHCTITAGQDVGTMSRGSADPTDTMNGAAR